MQRWASRHRVRLRCELRMLVPTLSSLSKRTMRFSWYSVSLSRMMSGSVTVADSSLLLLDWGRLDCLKEGGSGEG